MGDAFFLSVWICELRHEKDLRRGLVEGGLERKYMMPEKRIFFISTLALLVENRDNCC